MMTGTGIEGSEIEKTGAAGPNPAAGPAAAVPAAQIGSDDDTTSPQPREGEFGTEFGTEDEIGIADQASRGATIGDQKSGETVVDAAPGAVRQSDSRPSLNGKARPGGAMVTVLALAAGAAAFAYGARSRARPAHRSSASIDPVASRAAPEITGASTMIAASPAELYRRWRNYERFEDVLPEVERVAPRDDDRISDWTLRGPAGTRHQLVSRIVEDEPGKRIAWEATGSPAAHKGEISFEKQPRGTLVRLQMELDPPLGRVGATASRLLGKPTGSDPRQVARKALKRMKQLVETGEIARSTADHRSVKWQ